MEINADRLIGRFFSYIEIDSETGEERDFALYLMEELKGLGLEVEMDKAGDLANSNAGNIIARLKGRSQAPPLMFSAHMDTVSPGQGIEPKIVDGVVYSKGQTILGADDKAGIAAIVEGVQMILEEGGNYPDLELVFTISEEGGLDGAKNLDLDNIKAELAYILDSSGRPGRVVTQAPAQCKLDFEFLGRSAHAGVAPEKGISAIELAAKAISRMKLLRIDEETSANIGLISGGVATNIVADSVHAQGEVRSLSNNKLKAQVDHMVEEFEKVQDEAGLKGSVTIEPSYQAYKIDQNDEILALLEKAMDRAGLIMEPVVSGGGSDANVYNQRGLAAVNLAIGMEDVHSLSEFIRLEDLSKSTELVYWIIKSGEEKDEGSRG